MSDPASETPSQSQSQDAYDLPSAQPQASYTYTPASSTAPPPKRRKSTDDTTEIMEALNKNVEFTRKLQEQMQSTLTTSPSPNKSYCRWLVSMMGRMNKDNCDNFMQETGRNVWAYVKNSEQQQQQQQQTLVQQMQQQPVQVQQPVQQLQMMNPPQQPQQQWSTQLTSQQQKQQEQSNILSEVYSRTAQYQFPTNPGQPVAAIMPPQQTATQIPQPKGARARIDYNITGSLDDDEIIPAGSMFSNFKQQQQTQAANTSNRSYKYSHNNQ